MRGRPPYNKSDNQVINDLENIPVKKDEGIMRAADRKQRVPLYKQNINSYEERAGYVRGTVLEKNVDKYLLAGWDYVLDKKADLRDERAQDIGNIDSRIRIRVNQDPKADSHYAFLMEIPIEYWLEDRAVEQKAIDKTTEAIDPKKNKVGSMDYGYFEMSKK